MINRSEAVHTLKLASAAVNNAISGVREGYWRAGVSAVQDAIKNLETLLPLLEGNADIESEFLDAVQPRGGGLGYQGSRHRPSAYSNEDRHATRNYPETTQYPVVNNTPPPKLGNRKPPIIPPAPVSQPGPAPTVIPEGPIKFDLSRITGMPEFLESFSKGTVSPLDGEEQRVCDLFNRLPEVTREKIISRYRENGKPVFMKIREVPIRVKET